LEFGVSVKNHNFFYKSVTMNAYLSEQDLAQASMPKMNTLNARSSELDLAQARFPRSGSWMLAQASSWQ